MESMSIKNFTAAERDIYDSSKDEEKEFMLFFSNMLEHISEAVIAETTIDDIVEMTKYAIKNIVDLKGARNRTFIGAYGILRYIQEQVNTLSKLPPGLKDEPLCPDSCLGYEQDIICRTTQETKDFFEDCPDLKRDHNLDEAKLRSFIENECLKVRAFPPHMLECETTILLVDPKLNYFKKYYTITRINQKIKVDNMYKFIVSKIASYVKPEIINALYPLSIDCKFRKLFDETTDEVLCYEFKCPFIKKEIGENDKWVSVKYCAEIPISMDIGEMFEYQKQDVTKKYCAMYLGLRLAVNKTVGKKSRFEAEFEDMHKHCIDCTINRFRNALNYVKNVRTAIMAE
ncbi:hypothetical protein PvNV_021 [Penaeus vannamei nudivirus]|nr:hypothetical protein PvSNPV_021 [Penaeus vannamei nucleopolyhedrovirus]